MVNFETEIYHRQADDVIGMKVMVIADSGQTIDSIHCINETDFIELESRLDTLNEEYVQFDENSALKGTTIDEILANASEIVTINATRLNGFQSDEFAKTNHTHLKQSITNLYNYDISLSSYNINIGEKVTVTVKVTDMSNSPVNNHHVIIYRDSNPWVNGYTNRNGEFSSSFTAIGQGLVTFAVNNQKVQCLVEQDTGWITLELSDKFRKYSDGTELTYRVKNGIVHIEGIISNKSAMTLDYEVVAKIPDEHAPLFQQSAIMQGTNYNRYLLYITRTGEIQLARYGITKQEVTSEGAWLHVYMTYFL